MFKKSRKQKFITRLNPGSLPLRNTASTLKRLSLLKQNTYSNLRHIKVRQLLRMNTFSALLFQNNIKYPFKVLKRLLKRGTPSTPFKFNSSNQSKLLKPSLILKQTLFSLKNMYDNSKLVYYRTLLTNLNTKSYVLDLFIYKYL